MRHHLLFMAGLAAIAAATAPASAAICRQDSDGRLIANGPVTNCERAYGYYDDAYRWHTNRIDQSLATGYYDPAGHWVIGAPNGYYNREHVWVAFTGDPAASGYRDADGRWVPIGVTGYYTADGNWVPAARPGHYEGSHWVQAPVTGHYSQSGAFIPAKEVRDETYWVAETEPGYYDSDGRWHAGQVTGYYDARGHWVTLSGAPTTVAYQDARPHDVTSREAWIETRIQHGIDRGEISRGEADRARDELAAIRSSEGRMRGPDGQLSAGDEALLQQRLDHLSVVVHADRVG